MHVPDGFLTGAVSAGTAVVSAGGIAAARRQTRTQLAGKRLPLAGLMAAGIYVLQIRVTLDGPLDQDGLLNLFDGDEVGRNVVLQPATAEDMCGGQLVERPSLEVVYDSV